MVPRIRRMWLKALRSGQYHQGEGYLCQTTPKGDVFCCLGVLAELAVQNNVIDGWEQIDSSILSAGDRSGDLPKAVVEWAGLTDSDPILPLPKRDYSFPTGPMPDMALGVPLSAINDGKAVNGTKPKTFKQIADLIERYLP